MFYHHVTRRRFALTLILAAVAALSLAAPARALDDDHRAKAKALVDKSIAYFRANQTADGSWSPKPGPAVTGLVVAAMLDHHIDPADPALAKAIAYILARQKPDGGIYDSILENYNTSIALMALGRLPKDDKTQAVITKAQDFLRKLQWSDQKDPAGNIITKDHRWFGGAGYGEEGRPDLSNTSMMLAGLHDSGLNCKDPAYQRALQFITSLQGSKANTTHGAGIVPDGGFIYAPSKLNTKLNELETKVGTSENEKGEDVDNGAGVSLDASGHSRLVTYGSITYAGFMSYLYAEMDPDDTRVKDAYSWVQHNWTLEENPRVGMQGYYYYLHTLSRALSAYGKPTLTTADGKTHDWANELIDKLATLQQPDGSFKNTKDRWLEGNPLLTTAYAILALEHALKLK